MKEISDQNLDQNMWNIIFSGGFVIVCILLGLILIQVRGSLPTAISIFDLTLVTLATFRLVRLFVYDKITRFLRDLFGAYQQGPMKTVSDLISCPWCFSIWAAAAVVFFYFLSPLAWLPLLILAVSGVASFIQIFSNMIGWVAENGKNRAHEKYPSI